MKSQKHSKYLPVIRGLYYRLFRKTVRAIDWTCAHAVRTKFGAHIVNYLIPGARPILCASCFNDHGLRLDAAAVGFVHALACPHCGAIGTRKLNSFFLEMLVSRFFVRGSISRAKYGAYPLVQFNDKRASDYQAPPWLLKDVALISEKAKIGIFHYGPRFWMFGEITPLKALQDPVRRQAVIDRVLKQYPVHTLPEGEAIYRLRRDTQDPMNAAEYDSAPDQYLGKARLDSPSLPVLYCSKDIEGCVHECRVTAEDELYLATLKPTRDLRLLDLTELLHEGVSEFESLDLAIHMLFFAAEHSYEITREIAIAAHKAGFDGLIYPSYYSQVRSGEMPLETVYGISVRRFPDAKKTGIFENVGIFGRPVSDGRIEVICTNRVMLHKVRYDIHFGPARPKYIYPERNQSEGKEPDRTT